MIDRMIGDASLTAAARDRLLAHRWPGNLRELANVLGVATSVCEGGVVDVDDLPPLAGFAAPRDLPIADPRSRASPVHEHAATGFPGVARRESAPVGRAIDPDVGSGRSDSDEALREALRAARWNVSEVARRLGLARMTIYRRMRRAGIVAPHRSD
jgi:transcriptional regulator of acetoin/glycerol metabolism